MNSYIPMQAPEASIMLNLFWLFLQEYVDSLSHRYFSGCYHSFFCHLLEMIKIFFSTSVTGVWTMIASIKIWMTKERESTNFQENQKLGVGLVVSLLQVVVDQCFYVWRNISTGVFYNPYIIDLYGFWYRMLVYLNDYQLVHVYSLIKVFNLLVHLL